MTGQHTPNTPGLIALTRAELAVTRANTCSHGVIRSRVRCADCDLAEKPKPPTGKLEAHE